MTSAIHNLPNETTFGLEFNYAVWTPGTSIRLANVPWNMDYRDIVYYPSDAALNTYLDANAGPTVSLGQMTYARPGMPIRVNLPFHAVFKYNYLRATNAAQPVPQGDTARSFYYFVTDVKYIAPNTTEIQVQLDVWQTFHRDVTFGNCFVERGHVDIANQDAFADNGREFLTIPEGLDIGNEYVIEKTYEHTLVDIDLPGTDPKSYGVIVMSTVALNVDYGNIDNPKLTSATGSLFEKLPNGCEIYYFDTPNAFTLWQLKMSDFPWITQGIIGVYVVPKIDLGTNTGSVPFPEVPTLKIYSLNGHTEIPDAKVTLAPNFRDDIALGRYANLKKFLTYPYTVIELTTYSGNPLVLKPECINRASLEVNRMTHLAPPNPRILIHPVGYNAKAGDTVNTYAGEFLDMATGIFDLPAFSVTNNGYLGYMASNRNAIAYQHSTADWSQQRALGGNATAFENATSGLNLQDTLTNQSVRANTAQTNLANSTAGWRAVQSGGNAIINGVEMGFGGNPVGGAINALQGGANAAADYAITENQNSNSTSIANVLAKTQNMARVDSGTAIRDSNRAYGDWAARGDYGNAIAGINAKVQDARMIQPTTSGQIGGDAFTLASYKWAVVARLKTVQPAVRAMIGEFWLRYGYAVNRFSRMPSTYQVMEKFTYWKLKETYITSSLCPEQYKQTLRGIFEKGVTVWSNPSDIGNIDIAANNPKTGVTL